MEYRFSPIAVVRSCFPEKFGIPRQPGLVPEAAGTIDFHPPYDREAVRGLEGFSHIWVLFVFHGIDGRRRSTVRPPRLGGNRRLGVFATRSGFRPNPIGLSVLELTGVETAGGGLRLHVRGLDLLDGTPVLDIKPYVPYADRIAAASGGYAEDGPPPCAAVAFAPEAEAFCRAYQARLGVPLARLVARLLAMDPRPGYARGGTAARRYGFRLMDLEVVWEAGEHGFRVTGIRPSALETGTLAARPGGLIFKDDALWNRTPAADPETRPVRRTPGAETAEPLPAPSSKEAPMPVKKILWPTDLSSSAAKALPFVQSLTRKYDAEIHVLYVMQDLTGHKWYGELGDDHAKRIFDWEHGRAKKHLETICQNHLEGCPRYIRHVAVGDPATEILRRVEVDHIDMVVMATRGASGRFAFGSVAEKVVKHARVPVVTVPLGEAAETGPEPQQAGEPTGTG